MLLLFTEFQPDMHMQKDTGFFMIGVTALNIIVNTAFMIWKTGDKVRMIVRRMLRAYRLRKRQNMVRKYRADLRLINAPSIINIVNLDGETV